MTHNRTADYWISPNALRIERNAMSLPDYIQASCTSGAQILCYIKDIITYDAGHNYRRWTLQASPTAFNTHTPKYVYVAIPRDMTKTTAQVVFPSEKIDIYGKAQRTTDGTTTEEQVGSEDYYYIFLQGILSSSGDNGTTPRQWTQAIDTGTLSSDEAINANNDSEWYRYDSVMQQVTFLKDMTMQIIGNSYQKFIRLIAQTISIATNGKIEFGVSTSEYTAPYVDGIASSTGDSTESANKIVTPKYMDDKALSKAHNDKTNYDLEMQNLRANGTADIFGNVTIQGNGKFSIGTYNKGIQGAQIDWYGNAEFESIVARSFLEVPELRYNRTTITVGNKWQTVGAGIIERVWAGTGDNALTGIAKLKLEPTEPGAIAVDDKCQGIFHFTTGNDTQTSDPKNGNYHFAGFTTVYFIVKQIYTADTLPADIKSTLAEDETIGDNQFFRYELRAKTCADLAEGNRNRWTDAHHPQPSMHFACYANATKSARQACRLTTTTYQLHLAGMTDWTYTQDQIRLIIGWLDGFTLKKQVWDSAQQKLVQQDKPLEGEGIAVGNMYMWGTIDQFDRAPSVIMQQLYYRSTDTKSAPDSITIATDRKSFAKGSWQTDHIIPSATDRYVWQQWLYTYSDGTYAVSGVSLYAIDNTLLNVTANRNIISVGESDLSDFFDPNNQDHVSFDVTAQLRNGSSPLAITTATAAYDSDNATMTYTTSLSSDSKTVTYHITLNGYVSVSLDGSVLPDTFVTLTLASTYGTASTVITIVQNREGEDGQNGSNGKSPYIGTNGNWWIGTTDTGQSATPEDPDVWTIGADGYWYFNGTKTTNKAIGSNGQAVLMSYAFRRSATTLTTAPTGGTFASPHPTTAGWSDGVPSGADPVYMSSRCFTSDGKSPQQSAWSTPCLMADTADIDICYNASTTQPSAPSEHGTQTTGGWHDTATENDIWMAVSSKTGGQWGNWQISKIKGEKGDPGTGITIKGSALKYFATPGLYNAATKEAGQYLVSGKTTVVNNRPLIDSNAYIYTYDADNDTSSIVQGSVGDTYVCADNGHLYVVEEYSAVMTTWIDCGLIKGQDGKSAYELWKEAGNTGTEADFLESLIGASGKSVSTITEYYARNNDKDNAPTGSDWSTTLVNPDASHLYLWNKETILDSDGEEITTTTPVIIATYTKDGKGISSITEWYALSTSKTGVTSIWSTIVPTMTATLRYLWNKETITYTDGSTTTTTPAVIGVYGDKGDKGDKGEQGAQGEKGDKGDTGSSGPRGYEGISVRRSEWQEGVYYRNDSADGSQDTNGNRYLDEVCITNAAQNTADWYVARPAHNGNLSSAANKPTSAGGSTYWQKMNDLSPIRTPYADIQTAFIQFLRVAQITLQQTNSQGQDEIYGAFGNPTGENQWPLWFGATAPANAPFRVNAQGEIISANINTLFQDMRPITGSYEYMNNENHMDLAWIKQGSTYTVVQEAGVAEVPTQIQKNVFNLRVDGINIILPTASSWIGQRVLLYNGCRKKQAQDNVDLGQEVTTVQIITPIERDDNGYLLPGAGVAKQFAGARQQNIKTNIADGQSAYQLNTTSYCYEVEFWDGVMEFIGVPDDDGTCIWAIINDSAGAVWYDGNPIRNMI